MEKITKRIGALKSVEECTHTLSEMVARHRHVKATTEEFDSMKVSRLCSLTFMVEVPFVKIMQTLLIVVVRYSLHSAAQSLPQIVYIWLFYELWYW